MPVPLAFFCALVVLVLVTGLAIVLGQDIDGRDDDAADE